MPIPIPFAVEIPDWLGNVRVTYYVTENCRTRGQDCQSIRHNHVDYEVRYVAAGTGNQTVGETFFPLGAGDLILLHPGEYHIQTESPLSPDSLQFSFRFSIPPLPASATEAMRRGHAALVRALGAVGILRDSDRSLAPLFRVLAQEIERRSYGYFYDLRSVCSMILVGMLRLAGCEETHIFPPDDLRSGGRLRVQLDWFFTANYMENVKLRDLARAIGVSERHASRCIKQMFGINYPAKLLEFRLQQARFQLAHTNKEISRIAVDCGFQSATYFSTTFRKALGISPQQFRERENKEQKEQKEQTDQKEQKD